MTMVDSRVYPGLERKPGGPDNWVERAGGLPKYIERIAKHLHYEQGFTISRAIAVAVNTVKRWAAGGLVAEHGTTKRVSPKTQALAMKAVAEWEAKKKAGRINLSELVDSASSAQGTGSATLSVSAIDLAEMVVDVQALAERAGQISDPKARAAARQAILDLAVPSSKLTADKRRGYAKSGVSMKDGTFPVFDATSLKSAIGLARTPEQRRHIIRRARALGLYDRIPENWKVDLAEEFKLVLDLASTIPPKHANGKAKDGRPSFKRQGKWGHGFVPLDKAAKEAKAKGSPIAMNRMNRLFGKIKAATGRAGGRSAPNKNNPTKVKVDEKTFPGSESARSIAHLQRTPFQDKSNKNRVTGGKKATLPKNQKEASKSSRVPERARQNWDEIPDALKTVRNGKRYVLAEFGGKQYVTEWVGGVHNVTQTPFDKRKVMRTLSSADAADMTPAQLRGLLNNPRTPAALKTQIRRVLRERAAKEGKTA